MPVILICANCGKQYSVPPSRAKHKIHFCSQTCMSQFNKGDRNPNWKGGLVVSHCRNCGAEIQTKLSHARKGAGVYCSRACQAAWKRANALGYDPNVRIKKQCQVCGKDIFIKPSHTGEGTYCSRECMAVGYKNRMLGNANPNYSGAGRRTCGTCGKEFINYQRGARFCSVKCRANNPATKKKAVQRAGPKVERKAVVMPHSRKRQKHYAQSAFRFPQSIKKKYICSVCGKEVWDYRPRETCSRECANLARPSGKAPVVCVVCGKSYEVYKSVLEKGNPRTCSRDCLRVYRSISQQGEKSHRWRGGLTSLVLLDRQSLPYQQWREAVFSRDDYTCQLCGNRGGRLSAHHIKPYATHPEYRREVGNGITLCWPCHASIKSKESEYEKQFFAITGGID